MVQVVKELYKCGLTEDDIGVITPYALQVKNIRIICVAAFEEKLPKIGSVEEFQGQEKKAIIISTVRALPKYIAHDGKYGLGFINNRNRLNVAISRARYMLLYTHKSGAYEFSTFYTSHFQGNSHNHW